MKLKAITLHQPWATWILWGWKRLETRTHPRFGCLHSLRIAIHAGRHWDENALRTAAPFLTKDQIEKTERFNHARGAIICTAYVENYGRLSTSYSQFALIECITRRFGLNLHDVCPIEPPIAARGRQGIFEVEIP